MKIKKSAHIDIIKHGQDEFPIECCGYILGKDGVIVENRRMYNVDQSDEHFTMDPKEQFEAMKEARDKGLEILGNYHSHPATPSRPSKEDIRLAHDSSVSYLIVSLSDTWPVLKSFHIENEEYQEEILEVIE